MNLKKLQAIFSSLFFTILIIVSASLPAIFGLGRLNLIYSLLFFWILFNPLRITFSMIIIISLLQDLLNHSYFGVQGCLYAAFIWFVHSQRRHLLKRNFTLLWLAFSVILTSILMTKYGWCYLMYHQSISIFEFVIESVIPILLFPALYRIYTFLYLKVFIPNASFI